MFLVLTSAAGVGDRHVGDAAAQLPQASAPRRLSDCAVEIGFRGARPDFVPVAGVDANFVPSQNRLKKLLIADMDSTIIPVECIDELADFAGIKDRVVEITNAVLNDEIDFETALEQRVALLAGLSEKALQQVYEQRISLNPGARILVQTMNALGAHSALVSGGFTFFSQRVGADAGFIEHHANTLNIKDGALTGKVGYPILGREAKLTALNRFCRQLRIEAADVLAVGDGANDLMMIEAAGLGVAYRAKPALADKADAVLQHSDLTALLALQGIAATDYVS